MTYRKLGSQIKISRIGLGGNVFGYFTNQKETTQIIAEAAYLGINFIDTASVYSKGLSEILIGQAIKKDRPKWIIATKVGVQSHEKPDGKGTRDSILKSVEGSLKRLKTDYIDLYQMHHYDSKTPLEETISALEFLAQQGKIRAFGVTNYTSEQLLELIFTIKQLNFPHFISVQQHYNLFKRDLEKQIFPIAVKNNLGIIVYGALARGILSGKYKRINIMPARSRAEVSQSVRNDLTTDVIRATELLQEYARYNGWILPGLALAWTLLKSEVSSVLVGIRFIKQLQIVKQALGIALTHKHITEMDSCIGDLSKYKDISLGSFISLA